MDFWKYRKSLTAGNTYVDPPLQEVAQPVWPERRGIVWEWTLALFLAFIAALLIRALFFEAFRIPSESMEDTLQVGDFVLVSKLHYGPRLPVTIGLPFTDVYLENVGLPKLRIPGFSEVKRSDVIVFNVPTETSPVDRKTHYIKRVIGLPGDSLSIIDKVPYAGTMSLPLTPKMKQLWRVLVREDARFPVQKLKEQGVTQIYLPQRRGDPIRFHGTAAIAEKVERWEGVESVKALVRNTSLHSRLFPHDSGYSFDNYGPLYVPQRGDTIHLNDMNWDRYQEIITRHEDHQARKLDAYTYEIDGDLRNYYVVEQDYYFVMGDNRDSSLDSRAWGFVPMDHIVGKALMVYFSWNPDYGKARTERFFSRIR